MSYHKLLIGFNAGNLDDPYPASFEAICTVEMGFLYVFFAISALGVFIATRSVSDHVSPHL